MIPMISRFTAVLFMGVFWTCQAFGQVENFDSLAVPALPEGWFSTITGNDTAPRFITANNFSDTAPNSLFVAGFNSVNRTMIHSPQFFTPKVPTQIIFRHKFAFEHGPTANYDGAQLFYVPDALGSYGSNYEWTVQAGSFSQGGYTGTVDNLHNNQIGGLSAWVGDQSTFTTVTADLPINPATTAAQIGWALFSDNSVSSQGWWIDSVAINPSVNLKVEQSQVGVAYLGSGLTVVTSVTNTSGTVATNVKLHQTVPQDTSIVAAAVSSGALVQGTRILDATFPTILPGATATLNLTVNVPSSVSSATFLEVTSGDSLQRRTFPLRHLAFTPSLQGNLPSQAIISFDFVSPTDDACQTQALGSSPIGKIGFTNRGTCTLEEKIKNLQFAGEVAAIILDDTNDPVAASGSSAGITIPAFLAQSGDRYLLNQVASAGLDVALRSVGGALNFNAAVLGDQFDPNALNNSSSMLVATVTDTRQQDFVASLVQAKSLLKGLKLGTNKRSKRKMAERARTLKALMQNIKATQATIAGLLPAVQITSAINSASKAVLKAARLQSRTFTADKAKALKALEKARKLGASGL